MEYKYNDPETHNLYTIIMLITTRALNESSKVRHETTHSLGTQAGLWLSVEESVASAVCWMLHRDTTVFSSRHLVKIFPPDVPFVSTDSKPLVPSFPPSRPNFPSSSNSSSLLSSFHYSLSNLLSSTSSSSFNPPFFSQYLPWYNHSSPFPFIFSLLPPSSSPTLIPSFV